MKISGQWGNKMDLKHLQTFLALCEFQNFTRTAEYLHYAQSNVTAQIQQLEKELNVRLFERLGKKVTLTSSGRELVPYAKRMLHLSEDIKTKFSEDDIGRIIVGASESICIYKLPAVIKEFQTTHPAAELYLRVLDTSDYIPLLADNTIDIAITLDLPVNNPNIMSAVQTDEVISFFSSPDHILSEKQNISIHDIAEHRLILTGKDCCYRKMFEKELTEAALISKIALETSSLQVIKQAVLSGLGICLLPEMAVQMELKSKELAKINYQTDYHIVSQVLYHKDKWISPNLSDFIELSKRLI